MMIAFLVWLVILLIDSSLADDDSLKRQQAEALSDFFKEIGACWVRDTSVSEIFLFLVMQGWGPALSAKAKGLS